MPILLLQMEMSSVLAITVIILKLGRTFARSIESGHSTKVCLNDLMVNSMFIETDDEIHKTVI